jgi:hypothetical protein
MKSEMKKSFFSNLSMKSLYVRGTLNVLGILEKLRENKNYFRRRLNKLFVIKQELSYQNKIKVEHLHNLGHKIQNRVYKNKYYNIIKIIEYKVLHNFQATLTWIAVSQI